MTVHNIALVDAGEIFRAALRALLERQPGLRVLLEFDSLAALKSALPFAEKVQLLILDPGPSDPVSLALAEDICRHPALPPLLLLATEDNPQVALRYFRLGARAYLPKSHRLPEFLQAVHTLLGGGHHHNTFLAASLLDENGERGLGARHQLLQRLSTREREFLKWVCCKEDYTYGQIADRMNVQLTTVQGYRRSIFHKFNVHSRSGLTVFVLHHDLKKLL